LKYSDKLRLSILIFSLILLFLSFPFQGRAFYEWQGETGYFELRGMVRGFAITHEYPENEFFYEDRSVSGGAAIARILMQGQAGQYLGFEVNAYQTYIPASLSSSQSSQGTPLDVERSSSLEWSFSDDDYVHLAIDRLNVFYAHDRFELIVGRQPINLATTFYFTPNDFFAPFAAQTFYRVYKPGVDAVRTQVQLGSFSQLSLINVFGYEQAPNSDTGWSKGSENDRVSYIGKISTVFNDFEYALLAGVVRETNVIGGSLQGELFQWIGVRAEGHITDPDDPQQDSFSELSFGIEHRWENSLDIRFEQFYNGSGFDSINDYAEALTATESESTYLGRNYSALGIGYELTPLLNAQMLVMANLMDHSYLLSFNSVYSLSDEAELAFNFGIPIGKKPEGVEIESEFGLYPSTVNIEVRYYF